MSQRLETLFEKYQQGTLSAPEETELLGLVLEPSLREEWERLGIVLWESTEDGPGLTLGEKEIFFENLFQPAAGETEQQQPGKLRSLWVRWAVAASILLVLAAGGYWFLIRQQDSRTTKQQEVVKQDVEAPHSNRAMITLANGETVYLDSAVNGQLAMQGKMRLMKLADGQIVYNEQGTTNSEQLIYNTLTNPRGSKVIDMQLSDGSHVWLNAGSSVTYPVAFATNERKVSITGEAYFEVAHDASKPFFVSKGDLNVQVLGTKFNVNAYDDESDIKVTLLEGSVKVLLSSGDDKTVVIKPGQQAIGMSNGQLRINKAANINEVMAWKEGRFKFTDTDLKVIMREIARWYNVEVSYDDDVPVQLYNVGVPRTANVSEVLKGLEYTEAHFTIEERRIVVRR